MTRCAAAIIWLTILTTLPCPTGPTCTIFCPMVSSSGRHRSSNLASPPTMMVSVPCAAAGVPPLTGASSTSPPAAVTARCDFLHAHRRCRRHVDEYLARGEPVQHAILAEHDLLELLVGWHDRDDDVRRLGHFGGRLQDLRSSRRQFVGRRTPPVEWS